MSIDGSVCFVHLLPHISADSINQLADQQKIDNFDKPLFT